MDFYYDTWINYIEGCKLDSIGIPTNFLINFKIYDNIGKTFDNSSKAFLSISVPHACLHSTFLQHLLYYISVHILFIDFFFFLIILNLKNTQ